MYIESDNALKLTSPQTENETNSSWQRTSESSGNPWLATALNVIGNYHAALLIDTEQYAENVRIAVEALRSDDDSSLDMQVLAVMKANAYGRGVSALAPMAKKAGAAYIGFVDNWEAKAARQGGWTGPLFRMRGAFSLESGEAFRRIGVEEWVGSSQAALKLHAAVASYGKPLTNFTLPERLVIDPKPASPIRFVEMPELPVHFALGGPMNRNAFQTAEEAKAAAQKCANLCVVGLLIHMPLADAEPSTTMSTFNIFAANVLKILPDLFNARKKQSEACQKRKIVIHWANSPTAIQFGNSLEYKEYAAFRNALDGMGLLTRVTFMARLGKSLFGLQSVDWSLKPCPKFGHLDGSIAPHLLDPSCPKPSMGPTFTFVTWGHQAHVHQTWPVTVGYGSPELTSKRNNVAWPSALATLPVGWADGIPDSIGNFPSKAHGSLEIDHAYDRVTVEGQIKAHPGRVRIVGESHSAMGYVVGKLSMNMTVVDVSKLGLQESALDSNMFLYVMLGDGVTMPPGTESRGNVNIGKSADSNPEVLRVTTDDPKGLWKFFSLALIPGEHDEEGALVWQALQQAHQLERSPSQLQDAARATVSAPIPLTPSASKLAFLQVKAIEASVVLNPGDLMYLRQKIFANPALASMNYLLLDKSVKGYPFSGSYVHRNVELIYEKALEKGMHPDLRVAVQSCFGFRFPRHVLLVSGSTETDGPLGVLALTRVFAAREIRVSLFTDSHSELVLQAGFNKMLEILRTINPNMAEKLLSFIRVLPSVSDAAAAEPAACVASAPKGSSKEKESSDLEILKNRGMCVATRLKTAVAQAWDKADPVPIDGIFAVKRLGFPYRNRRGLDISKHTEPIDFLWPTVGNPFLKNEFRKAAGIAPNAISFGIGDAGNEVGMGKYVTLPGIKDLAPNVECQRTADKVLIATVSNWAGSAFEMAAQVMFPPEASMDYIKAMRIKAMKISLLEMSILQHIMEQPHYSVDGINRQKKLSIAGMDWFPSHQNLYDGLWAVLFPEA